MQFGEVKELIAIFEKTDLNDMEVQLDNAIVRLNRGRTAPMAPAIPAMPRDLASNMDQNLYLWQEKQLHLPVIFLMKRKA